MTKFVEVVDPYEKYTRRRKIHKFKPKSVSKSRPLKIKSRPVRIGDGPNCDYTKDEWDNMMEYYETYEHPTKSH